MSSAKGQLYANALDTARQEGRWNETLAAPSTAQGLTWPELLRKFNKHNPNESLTSLTAEVELKVHQSLQKAASEHHFNFDSNHERDCPFRSFPQFFTSSSTAGHSETPVLSPLVQSQSARDELRQWIGRLRDAQATQGPAGNQTVTAASIVLGFAEYALGDFEAAKAPLSSSSQGQDLPTSHLADLLVSSRTIQGLILERQQQRGEAFHLYEQALELYRRCESTTPEMLRWAERASYRRAMLSKSIHPQSSLRCHQEYVPRPQLPLKHATLLRSHLYQIRDTPTDEITVREVAAVQEHYEAILRRVTSFPKAGDVNTRMLDFVDRVFEIWLANNSQSALKQHSRHEVDEQDTLRVIAIMERALAYTFQSHRLLRYLLTLQMALNNKAQALKAFELYSKLWEKARETDLVNVSRKLRHFREEDESGVTENVHVEKVNGHVPTPVNQTEEEEADIDRPITYIGACGLAAKVYCSELRREGDAKKAGNLMKRAMELVPAGTSNEVKASVQKWCGIANACQVFDEADHETRPQLLKSALELLTQAVSDNPASFDAHYHLALIQAEHGQNDSALSTIRKALEINSVSSEAWNLFALLISADTSRKAEALQLVTAVLHGRFEADDAALFNDAPELPVGRISDALTFSALSAVIQLRITRIVLIEAIEGPQAALVHFKELYTSFAQDFAPFLQEERPFSPPVGHETAPLTANPTGLHPHLHAAAASLKLPSRRFSLRSKRSRKTSGNSPSRPESVAASMSPASSRPASVQDGEEPSPHTRTTSALSVAQNSGSLFKHRHRQARKLEQTLWLLTAATFRRANDMQQAQEAIYEAEKIDPTYPDVWVQLGLLRAQQGYVDLAIDCMDKALTFSLDHVPALVHMARLLITKREENSQLLDLAAGYMEECSQSRGHGASEVWLTLGQIYELQERTEEARRALLKALRLQESQPIRPLEVALPRIL